MALQLHLDKQIEVVVGTHRVVLTAAGAGKTSMEIAYPQRLRTFTHKVDR